MRVTTADACEDGGRSLSQKRIPSKFSNLRRLDLAQFAAFELGLLVVDCFCSLSFLQRCSDTGYEAWMALIHTEDIQFGPQIA